MDTFQEQLNRWMRDWRNNLERMRLHLELGKLDARIVLQEQQDKLHDHLQEWKKKADELTALSQEQRNTFRAAYEQALLQLHLGKTDASDAMLARQEQLHDAMAQLKTRAEDAFGKGKDVVHALESTWAGYQTNIELLRIQLALGQMEARDKAAELQQSLHVQLSVLQSRYDEYLRSDVEAIAADARKTMESLKGWLHDRL